MVRISEDRRQLLLVVAAFLSLICFFSSFLLFAYALHIKVTVDARMALIETYNSDVLPGIFVAVACVNLIQNVTAVYVLLRLRDPEAREGKRVILLVVLIGGIILVLFEVSSAIVSFVHIGILDEEFRKGIVKAMEQYIDGEELKREIDGVQMDYQCCGDSDYTDWFKHPWLASDLLRVPLGSQKKYTQGGDLYYADDTPYSCCDLRAPRPCIHHHIHDDKLHFEYDHKRETTLYVTGCRHVLMDIYGVILLTVGSVAMAIAAVKICVLLLFRLIQTSLHNAEEGGDWTATTNAYIYYEKKSEEGTEEDGKEGTEDEKQSVVGSETDASEAGANETGDSGADDISATSSAGDESDFTNNASSTTDYEDDSSFDEDVTNESETDVGSSSSWEDLEGSITDGSVDEGTTGFGAMKTARRNRSRSTSRSLDRKRDKTSEQWTRRPEGKSFQDQMFFSKHGIGPGANVDNSHYQRNVRWREKEDKTIPLPFYNPRETDMREDYVIGKNTASNAIIQPKSSEENFTINGTFSKMRRPSASFKEEDETRKSLVETSDQGLLSRIKEHLSNTGPAPYRTGFGGLFSNSRAGYARLSAQGSDDEDSNDRADCRSQSLKHIGAARQYGLQIGNGPISSATIVNETPQAERRRSVTRRKHVSLDKIVTPTCERQDCSENYSDLKNVFNDNVGGLIDATNIPALPGDNSGFQFHDNFSAPRKNMSNTDEEPHNVTGDNVLHNESASMGKLRFNLTPSVSQRRSQLKAERAGTPFPVGMTLKANHDESEYDLVPTNMRPGSHASSSVRELSTTEDTSQLTESTDLDAEVADITSGNSSRDKYVRRRPPSLRSLDTSNAHETNSSSTSNSKPPLKSFSSQESDSVSSSTNTVHSTTQAKQSVKGRHNDDSKSESSSVSSSQTAPRKLALASPSSQSPSPSRGSHVRSCHRSHNSSSISPVSANPDFSAMISKPSRSNDSSTTTSSSQKGLAPFKLTRTDLGRQQIKINTPTSDISAAPDPNVASWMPPGYKANGEILTPQAAPQEPKLPTTSYIKTANTFECAPNVTNSKPFENLSEFIDQVSSEEPKTSLTAIIEASGPSSAKDSHLATLSEACTSSMETFDTEACSRNLLSPFY